MVFPGLEITMKSDFKTEPSNGYLLSGALLDLLPTGVVVHDAEGRITSANPAAESILGLTFDQMRGVTSNAPLWKATHEDGSDFPGSSHPAMQALRTKSPVLNVAMRVFNPKTQSQTSINIRTFPILKARSEEVECVYALFEDVTELVDAQKKERESSNLYHSLVSALPIGVVLQHRDWGVLACNQATERILGVTTEQLMGMTAFHPKWKIIREDGTAFPLKEYPGAALFRDGVAQPNTVMGVCKLTDQVTWISVNASPVFDPDGKSFSKIVVSFVDVTEQKRVEKDRRDQHDLLHAILATTLDGYWLANMNGKLLDVNEAACAMLGYTRAEALNLHVADIDVVDDQQVIETRARRMQVEGGDFFESRHRRKDGSIIDVEVSIRHLPQNGAFSVFVRDITQRKLAEAKNQLAASVFENAREGIVITDVLGAIVDINEAFTQITGFSRTDAIGQNPRILKSGLQDLAFYKTMWDALTTQGHWAGEIWNRRKNGEVYAQLLNITAVRDASGKTRQYVSLFSDISSIKEHQRQLERIAHFDPLTQLPNRLLLNDRMRQAMAQALRREQQFVVAYLDLDGFKEVNDRYGHSVGDQLLISLSAALNDTLREGDTLARIGGDEFVAVLIDVKGIESCTPTIKRLLEVAASTYQAGREHLRVSASIGVTIYPQEQEIDASQLLQQADQAMYQAKMSGKNRHHFFVPTTF